MLWSVYNGRDQMSRDGHGVICGKGKQLGESVFVAAMHAKDSSTVDGVPIWVRLYKCVSRSSDQM
jgi:hypothetical protein